MMNMRPDSFDSVEPHAMDKIEIIRRQGRRMGAEMIECVDPAAVMVDGEAELLVAGFLRTLPGFPKKLCLSSPRGSWIRRRELPTSEA